MMHPTLITLIANERTESLRADAVKYPRGQSARARRGRRGWHLRAPRVAHA
jgi:hypothetical protein